MVRHRKRRARHGFTLVELMVSLVMGLIVSLAAVGLARTATTTFHEQARSSVTEMGVRSAADRLRQDLMRVSYMSTGNVALDPKIAYLVEEDGSSVGRYKTTALKDLQGIYVKHSQTTNTVFNDVADNNSDPQIPDAIDITGNLTTDDAYTGTIMSASGCGSQMVSLDPQADAAVYSLSQTSGSLLAAANAAFRPGNHDFPVRVVDPMGCQHYAIACGVAASSGKVNVLLTLPNAMGRPVLYSHGEGSKGVANNCGASEGGRVTISPLARVRWELSTSASMLAATDNTAGEIGSKVDLTRQLFDAYGDAAGSPEIVAEYAVDLKFALTVWNPELPGTNKLEPPYDFVDTTENTTPFVSPAVQGKVGPQHVRAVRFRIATRTALPDRAAPLPSPIGFKARFCVDVASPCTRYARVRTVVSEVTLQNQARMFY